jgi:sulfoxide reductase catalytic subunit YedY
MLIKSSDSGFNHPVASDITPKAIYEQRREWLRLMAGGVAGAALASWAGRDALAQATGPVGQARQAGGATGRTIERARRRDDGKAHRIQGR